MSASPAVMARQVAQGEGGFRLDVVTIALTLSILLLGLVMVGSASISMAAHEPGGDPFAYLERQLLLMLGGIVCAAVVARIPTDFLDRNAFLLLILAGALLLAVLIPGLGHVVNGSRRWIRVAGFNFQASEGARVLVLSYVASYAVRREKELRESLMGLARPLGLLLLFALLLLGEPDFGAATVLVATGFGLLFLAGAQLRWVAAFTFGLAALGSLAVLLAPYRMKRLMTFLDPWADPFNSGFQLTQSLIAIGRGDWFGVGLGESVQKLFYLPEAHTDFLFAVLAEELGLAGVVLTLVLFLALVWRVFYIAKLANDAGLKFQSYLAAAFGLWLGIQACINMGVNMGALPTKGLTLPLMSYGRSSLIVTIAWMGIVLRVYHEATGETRGVAGAVRRRAAAAAAAEAGT
jgi:cell division protein FtsW